MDKIENYGTKLLTNKENYEINGGTDPAEGSYGAGHAIGSFIRDAFSGKYFRWIGVSLL